jgi:hypothetical protein
MGCEPTYNIANMADFEWSSLIPPGRLEGAGFAGWRPTRPMERLDLSQAISSQ